MGQETNDAGTRRRNGETEVRGQKTAGRKQLGTEDKKKKV
jgi:hypothetical protein